MDKDAVKKEFNSYYGNLVENLVEKNRQTLTEETLQELVRQHIQQLDRLTVVYLDGKKGEPLLMYNLGNKILFRSSCFYTTTKFYVEVFDDDGVPIVKKYHDVCDVETVKNLVLEYFTKNEERKEITVCSRDDYNWVFKFQYSTDKDGNVDNIENVKYLETLFEVVREEDFEKALKKILVKLSKVETAVTFFDFRIWWNGKFLQMLPAHQIYKKLPLFVKYIKRLDMSSNSFSFIVSL